MNQSDTRQSLGCGGLIVLAVFFVMITSKCSEEPEFVAPPEQTAQEKIAGLAREIPAKEIEIAGQKQVCESDARPRSLQDEGKLSQIEWDIAAAENIEHISPAQEWEIRRQIGAEMGLAPSEVNGWKDIYRNRAEAAKRRLEIQKDEDSRAQRRWENGRAARCELHARLQRELVEMQVELRELKALP